MKFTREFNRDLSLIAQIILPVIFLGLLVLAAGTKIINRGLEKEITRNSLGIVNNFGNEIKQSLLSEFKIYNQRAKNSLIKSPKEDQAVKTKALAEIDSRIRNSDYDCIVLQRDKTVWKSHGVPSSELVEKAQQGRESIFQVKDYFVYHYYFQPWDWDIILFQSTAFSQHLLEKNTEKISGVIFVLLTLIILFIFLVLRFVVRNPIEKILATLKKIEEEDYEDIELYSSKELSKLALGINHMSATIRNREDELISEKQKVLEIMDSQSSIVLLSTGSAILEANRRFFDFFYEYENLESFRKDHSCVCDFFERTDDPLFVYQKADSVWVDEIIRSVHQRKVLIKRGNREYTFNIMANYLRGSDNQINVVTLTDITELEDYRKELEKSRDELKRQLHTDQLTGLPNRLALLNDIEKVGTHSLIIINIDSFQEINDFFGTLIGDYLLVELGRRIESLAKEIRSVRLYKLSSDEYAIHMPACTERSILYERLREISEFLNDQVYTVEANQIRLSVSMGAAMEKSSHELFTHADIALKTAKRYHQDFRIYDDSLKTIERYQANIELTYQLKKAIEENRIILYFQPIVSLANPALIKHEVLVRMISESGEIISPQHFLDVAKKVHIYDRITEIVLNASIDFFKHQPGSFSINISGEDIFNHRIRDQILQKVRESGIAEKMIFELTETEEIQQYAEVDRFIKEVKSYGARVAIDDFGSGYSNFQRIMNLNVDFLKIDGSLIKGITTEKSSRALVETIVAFAKKAEIYTVAEYVDSEEILEESRSLGIDFVQGFFISRPVPKLGPPG